ncbi:MAG: LacI family DNA-binding transcriptional regulator [Jatrophihabitans sp.]
MTITLQDVADAAGVSRSTASRALSGSTAISAQTRTAVRSAADQIGYRVNRMASALRSNNSHLIGLVLNNLINASFHTIAEVVQRRANDEGYQVILTITGADPKRERELLDTLGDHHVDGIVVIGTGTSASTTNRLFAAGTAIVNVIRAPTESAAPTVLAADRDGAYEAVRYLLSIGHRRIAYIGGPAGTNSGDERYAGYQSALADHNVAVDPRLVERGPFDPQFGKQAANSVLDRCPDATALFAANHEAAFGLLPALVARQVRVPQDLSLICYEDIPWFTAWQPPITVVDNGARELADLAMDLLLQQMNGRESIAPRRGRTYRVGAALVQRASCRSVQ